MAKKKGATATKSAALQRTKQPGVYRKANRYVAVYRVDGRQRKEYAATFDGARAIKLTRDAQSREQRRGVMLHSYYVLFRCKCGLEHLRAMKRAAGRPQDLEDLKRLGDD